VLRRFDSSPETQRLPKAISRLFVGAFSPDGRYFARTGPMGTVELEDGRTGQSLGKLRGVLQGVHSIAFSPDSRRLAAGSDDREAVKLWDLQSFQELVTLRGESTAFSQTRFSPDGNFLGTMNYKGVLHVWRAPSWAAIEAAERQGPIE
jgi:WD40 repeat protein